MKTVYQRLRFTLSAFITGLLAPLFAFAAEPPRDIPLQISILSQQKVTDLAQYIGLVYQYLTGIAGIFAVAMIMYGGMKWIFSAGDQGKIGAAKETINNAIVGLILALGSFLILNTINPNLVRLRVPPIQTISGVRLAAGWCPNAGEFAGRYRCGQSYTLGGETVGKCIGAACDAGGCHRSGEAYQCIDPATCPASCDAINALAQVTNDQLLRIYCESEACKSQMPTGCRVLSWTIAQGEQPSGYPAHPATKCIDRLRSGQLGCERHEDCARGLMCNFGESPNKCRPASGLGTGISCDADNYCVSKICNKGYLRDQCAPPTGSGVREPCDRDKDCGSEVGSNRVCNFAFSTDSCVQLRSLQKGQDCDRDAVCASGKCEGEEDDRDGDCT